MTGFFAVPSLAHAEESSILQEIKISGKVTDEQGQPLAGVTISIKDSSQGTVTNENGEYSIEADGDATLIVSFVGFQTQEINVNNRIVINISLPSSVSELEQLVVVGYGTQKKENLTGSISTISSKDLENKPLTNSSQALYGVNGVYVNQPGGNPGHDAAAIRIRGIGTLGSGGKLDPLVLVDEVQTSLEDVNPADIESISVLKDASSTAIYGSRAANGVILIRTKQGAKNEGLKMRYNGYVGFQKATFLPDAVSNSAEFMKGYNQALINQGGEAYYSNDLISEFENSPTSLLHPNTDWMKVLFGSALIHEHNVRISGGTEKSAFNVLSGYQDQDGVLKGMTGAKKYQLSMSLRTDISHRFGINLRVALMRRDIKQPSEGMGTAMNRIMRMVPIQPIGKMENGEWPDSWVLTPGQNSFQNPLVFKHDSYGRENQNHVLTSLSAHYNFTPDLQYKIHGSMVYNNSLQKNFMPVIWLHDVRTGDKTRNPYSSVGTKHEINSDNDRLNLTHTIEYHRSILDNHNLTILVGNSIEKYTTSTRNAGNTGYVNLQLDELSVGTDQPSVSGSSTDDRLSSVFGRVQYNFKEKYLFEANGRFDGSSRFARGNKWGFFPSFSAGWRISEEDFFGRSVPWTNDLKLRASWGKIGNQEIGRFQYVNSIDFGAGYPFGGEYDGGGIAVNQIKDPTIQWETTKITDIGLDWTGLKDRVSVTLDYFYKVTDNILRTITIPAQVGDLNGPTTNVAKVRNEGIDLSVNYRQNFSGLLVSIGGYISVLRNKVLDLNGETLFNGSRITKEGYPIDSWYVYETDGLFQSQGEVDRSATITSRVGPGDVKYVDRNNDGVIDGDDRYIGGNTLPDFTYGFNTSFTYKRFTLTTQWQGVNNIDVWWSGNLILPYNNGAGVTKKWLYNSWTPENPNADLPRLTTRHQYTAENFSPSDFLLQDASYLRLKNIQLKYDFGKISLLHLSGLSIFLNAQNLWTITSADDFDPEEDVTVEHVNKYPSIKTMSAGVVIDF